ncbi:alanyl-tRNA editing protein [Candidatus Woesearchaeota archaeon]|nr:MAG: alanyl-tRNA editing protein [Candidatus Woesearchaeota archaeon]
MAVEELFRKDRFIKTFEAVVQGVDEGVYITLDKTAFYPVGGGQPHDEGTITTESGDSFSVVFVKKLPHTISHQVDRPGLEPGQRVRCELNWKRRWRLMRMHTAAHVLSSILAKETGARITGNQLGEDQSRIDFSLEEFSPDLLVSAVAKANELTRKAIPVHVSVVARSDACKNPAWSKLAKGLPEGIEQLHIVKIGDVDVQVCGGTHVQDLKDVGTIVFIKAQNKGKQNRRLYFSLAE